MAIVAEWPNFCSRLATDQCAEDRIVGSTFRPSQTLKRHKTQRYMQYTAEIFPYGLLDAEVSTKRQATSYASHLEVFVCIAGSDPQHHASLNRGEMTDGRWEINEKQDMMQGTQSSRLVGVGVLSSVKSSDSLSQVSGTLPVYLVL